MTEAPPASLARSDAILRLLEAITASTEAPVQRLLLEGIAYMAQQPPYAESNCRVLRAFNSEEWLLDFHESLAYLQQMGRVKRVDGRYTLASKGEKRLAEINDVSGVDLNDEASKIVGIANKVRIGLRL